MKQRKPRAHWLAQQDSLKHNSFTWTVYRDLANWVEPFQKMTRFATPAELQLINKHGRFPFEKDGVVRDHKLSRQTGMLAELFPEILRHPVNCDFVRRSDNDTKAKALGAYRDSDSISVDELLTAVLEWEGSDWPEHARAKELALNYIAGARYNIDDYYQQYLALRAAEAPRPSVQHRPQRFTEVETIHVAGPRPETQRIVEDNPGFEPLVIITMEEIP